MPSLNINATRFHKVINLPVKNNMKGRKHIRGELELGYYYRDISLKGGIFSIGNSESRGSWRPPPPAHPVPRDREWRGAILGRVTAKYNQQISTSCSVH